MGIQTKSEEMLKEAIAAAQIAGVESAAIATANQKLVHLQTEEEVITLLENAMEIGDTGQLELAIQRAHDGLFVEEDSAALRSAVLQVHLRFWASEFGQALGAATVRG